MPGVRSGMSVSIDRLWCWRRLLESKSRFACIIGGHYSRVREYTRRISAHGNREVEKSERGHRLANFLLDPRATKTRVWGQGCCPMADTASITNIICAHDRIRKAKDARS